MTPSPWLRGCLTALAVALVLCVLRRAGPRFGGLAAAIPVTSVPALAWASWEQGAAFAAASATAALLATGMTGLFALRYAWAARRQAPWQALLAAALPALLLTGLVSGLGGSLVLSLTGATGILIVCGLLMPPATPAQPRVTHWHRELLMTMAVSGAVTALMTLIAPRVPPLLCGLVAAIPVVGMSTTVSVHAQGGSGTVTVFLRAYLQGLLAKLAFLGSLAATLPAASGPLPWLAATASGVVVIVLLKRLASLPVLVSWAKAGVTMLGTCPSPPPPTHALAQPRGPTAPQ